MVRKCLLILAFCSSYQALNDYNVQDFLQMFQGNVTASVNYQLPTSNEEQLQLTEDGITDFGEFDFIIVGGGSAGTLITNRLSEIPQWRILLLEAGKDENDFSAVPGATLFLQSSPMNWGYNTTRQTTCCLGMRDNRCVAPRGKVLGGSSVINVKMYVRCSRDDYNYWEQLGNKGWAYKDVLPYFKKTENTSIDNGDIGYHSTKGLLHVQYIQKSNYTQPYLDGLRELGIPQVDYNGKNQLGASPIQYTINGLEISSGRRAFIDPIRNRKNLNITLEAFVTKILFNGKQAEGVEFIRNGRRYRAKASKEVILSAGTYNSPQILMLSGIGPKEDLDLLGIKVIQNLPVGKNFQEHPLFLGFIVRTNQTAFNETLETAVNDYFKGKRPLISPINTDSTTFRKLINNQPRFSFNHWLGNNRNDVRPDIQQILLVPPGFYNLLPNGYNLNEENTKSFLENYRYETDFFIYLILLRPKSVGTVKLKTADPKDFPDIDFNLLSDPDNIDIITIYKGIVDALRLLETEAFKQMNATFVPIVKSCGNFNKTSMKYWECAIRQLTSTIYHPMGTTRMGTSYKNSVVTPELKVHGIKKLRVSDAGVMPSMPSGNLNAVVYMIAEKTADYIKKDYGVLW